MYDGVPEVQVDVLRRNVAVQQDFIRNSTKTPLSPQDFLENSLIFGLFRAAEISSQAISVWQTVGSSGVAPTWTESVGPTPPELYNDSSYSELLR